MPMITRKQMSAATVYSGWMWSRRAFIVIDFARDSNRGGCLSPFGLLQTGWLINNRIFSFQGLEAKA